MTLYTNLLEGALGIKVMIISYKFLRYDNELTNMDKEFICALLGIATFNYLIERDVLKNFPSY